MVMIDWWDLPSLSLFKGDGCNFLGIRKVILESDVCDVFKLDIPSLADEGIQLNSAFNSVRELNSSSMIVNW